MGRPRKEPPAPLTGSEKLPEPVKTAPKIHPLNLKLLQVRLFHSRIQTR